MGLGERPRCPPPNCWHRVLAAAKGGRQGVGREPQLLGAPLFSLNHSLIGGIIHMPQNPPVEAGQLPEVVPERDSGGVCLEQGQVILAAFRELVGFQEASGAPQSVSLEQRLLSLLCSLEHFS